MLNLDGILAELHARRQVLDQVIQELEKMEPTGKPAGFLKRPQGRRGRKTMGEEERQQVSARMQRYWADRRKVQLAATASS